LEEKYTQKVIRREALQATVGFVQVRLEVVAIGSSAYPSFSSGLTNIAKHWFLIFIFSKKPGSGYGRKEF